MEFWADVVPRREQHHAQGLTWELGERSFNGRERNPAFRNLGGLRFEDTGYVMGVDGIEDGRSAVTCDLDGNGSPDLIVSNREQPLRVWRHRGGANRRWCTVQLRDTAKGNREGVGAVVTCRGTGLPSQALPISAGAGFLSQGPAEACFGMGRRNTVDVTVRWPDGKETRHAGLQPGRWIIDRASGAVRPAAGGAPPPPAK